MEARTHFERVPTLHRRTLACLALAACLLPVLGCSRLDSKQENQPQVERGRSLIASRGCIACHVVPGVMGPDSNVGPPLDHMARRSYIAGVMANTPANMYCWLRNPPAVDPLTAMPNLGLRDDETRDIAAYLYTLD